MAHRLSGKVLAFIRSQRVSRLATVGPGGTPHNVPVCTAVVGSEVYFASESAARKVRNLRKHPHVALVFDHYSENWARLAGVMVVGRCAVIDKGRAFQRARAALYRKYKAYARVAPIVQGKAVIIRVTPTGTFSWGL